MTDKQNYSVAIARASSFLAQDSAMRAMAMHSSSIAASWFEHTNLLFVWKALFTSKLLREVEKEAAISADFSESWTGLIAGQDITGWEERPNLGDSKGRNEVLREMGGQQNHICFTHWKRPYFTVWCCSLLSSCVKSGSVSNWKIWSSFQYLGKKYLHWVHLS